VTSSLSFASVRRARLANIGRGLLAAAAATLCLQCKGSSSGDAASTGSGGSTPSATSVAAAAPPPAAAASIDHTATAGSLAGEYRGTIGGALAIVVRLTKDAGKVRGTYFYEKSGSDLELGGTLQGAHLRLDESLGKTKTGAMSLDLGPDGALTGTWTDAKGNKPSPFRAAPVHPDLSPTTVTVFKKAIRFTKPVDRADAAAGVCKASVEYAEVFGLKPEVEAKINPKLAPGKDELPDATCDHGVDTERGYSIILNDKGILSVRTSGSVSDSQAAHPSEQGFGTVNVFLADGTDVALFGDLLKPKTEAALKRSLAASVDAVWKKEKWEASDKQTVLDALEPPSSFVIEKHGLRFFADGLPHVVWALGGDGFLVPYAALVGANGRAAAVWEK